MVFRGVNSSTAGITFGLGSFGFCYFDLCQELSFELSRFLKSYSSRSKFGFGDLNFGLQISSPFFRKLEIFTSFIELFLGDHDLGLQFCL